MKIGILTLPLETNYGGILQNYALQQVLRHLGHDTVTIDWHNCRRYSSLIHNLVGWGNRVFRYYIRGDKVSVLWNPFINESQLSVIAKHTRSFVDKNIIHTRSVKKFQLNDIDREYSFDAYFVGSDQVWVNSYSLQSFLNFVNRPNVVKVAYAASSNEKSWLKNPELVRECVLLSNSFNGLSARETNLSKNAQDVLNRKVWDVLDPTMLLSVSDYRSLYSNSSIIQIDQTEQTMFSYILDETVRKNAIENLLAESLKLNIVKNMPELAFIKKRKMDLQKYIFPPVEDWLQKFDKSSFVITDSFHGTVFSILYNKQFIAIANKDRGLDRFYSLLSKFGLERRLITKDCVNNKIIELANIPIDYSSVNRKLQDLKKDSLKFIESAIQGRV